MDSTDTELREKLPLNAPVMTAGVILAAVGWIGLALLFVFTLPTLGPRWLLYFLATIAFSGSALPVVRYFHMRFPRKPAATMQVLVREAIFVGMYADILIWLQLGQALNFALVIIIAAGLFSIEWIIRLSERSKWVPPQEPDEPEETLPQV